MPPATDTTAILDVYSGQANPSVTLSNATVSDLRARLSQLPSASAGEPPQLGYRGMVVEEPGEGSNFREIRAYHGRVTISDETSTTYRQDVAGIETLLLREVASAGTASILTELASLELDALLRAVRHVRFGQGLVATVQRAQSELRAGRVRTACVLLVAFLAQVRSHSQARILTPEVAGTLERDAKRIQAMIGCS